MFVNKNKVKDSEGDIQDILGTVSIPAVYTMPTGWTSRDTGCHDTDTNYTIDKTALEGANIWTTGQYYWLASRNVNSSSSRVDFVVCYVLIGGDLYSYDLCNVTYSGRANGRSNSSSNGLRPCISLKSDIIRITGGDGTSEGTAYIIGK